MPLSLPSQCFAYSLLSCNQTEGRVSSGLRPYLHLLCKGTADARVGEEVWLSTDCAVSDVSESGSCGLTPLHLCIVAGSIQGPGVSLATSEWLCSSLLVRES